MYIRAFYNEHITLAHVL